MAQAAEFLPQEAIPAAQGVILPEYQGLPAAGIPVQPLPESEAVMAEAMPPELQ